MKQYDIIVIGGGVNSLVTANLLAQSGKKVLLLEKREEVGGLASTFEFTPGYKCNLINDVIKWIDPRVLKQLDLKNQGLEFIEQETLRIALDDEGNMIAFEKDPEKTAASIKNHSKIDADKWVEFTEYINKLAQFFERLYELTPPYPPDIGLKDVLGMRSMLKPLMKHGSRGLIDLIKVAPMMMPELVDEWFENKLLRSAIATSGIHHLSFGPFAAATGYNLLHQHTHSNGIFHNARFVKGGTGTLTKILRTSAESLNVEIQTNSKVNSIDIKKGSCFGVTLENGEAILGQRIVSGLDPNNTFKNLVGFSNLEPTFHTQIQNIKYRGAIARAHFALNDLPKISGIDSDKLGAIFSFCPSIEYLEKASDAVKYGNIAENPYIEFTVPSVINQDFAPNKKHVLSATLQYAPYKLRNQKWTTELKSNLNKQVVQILGTLIPNFSNMIESSTLFSPLDLENEFGLTEGNLNHGEMTLDQLLFMRPTMSSSQYKTPIENLFLCGPGTHPGGGLHGTNGYNAAKAILK